MGTKHTPGPWEFKDHDSALADDDEVTELVGANGETVLEIGTGGFACESDPYGSYPILEASDEDWALIKAAPGLLTELQSLADFFNEFVSTAGRGESFASWSAKGQAKVKRAREVLALATPAAAK